MVATSLVYLPPSLTFLPQIPFSAFPTSTAASDFDITLMRLEGKRSNIYLWFELAIHPRAGETATELQ